MKKLFLGLFVVSICFTSCKKDEIKLDLDTLTEPFPGPQIMGNYKGTFTYITPEGKRTDSVSLELGLVTYMSPGIGKNTHMGGSGTYSYDKNKVVFTDERFVTADFDWNLLLVGTYEYTLKGKELALKRSGTDKEYEYTYQLQKY